MMNKIITTPKNILWKNQEGLAIFSTVDEFSLKGIDLKRGHYILNVFTSKGFTKKEIIVVE